MTEARNRRAALYCRVSTEEQVREGMSIETQLSQLRKWAAERGYRVVGEYIDGGFTGREDNRPQLRRMMWDASKGQFDVVASAKIDRLMRNVGKLRACVEELRRLGIDYCPLDYPTLDTTASGDLVLSMLGAMAQFESARIGERVRDVRQHMKAQGRLSGGRAPYGYRWDKEAQRFEVVDDEREVVRLVFDLYVNHNLAIIPIVRELNGRGDTRGRPMRSSGNSRRHTWHSKTVADLLHRKAYTGQDGPYRYPPIIDEATYEAAQYKLRTARKIQRNPDQWLLQGYATCGLCGRRLTPKRTSATRFRYVCIGRYGNAHLDGSPRCDLPSAPAAELERAVWHKLARAVNDHELLTGAIQRGLEKLESRQGSDGASSIHEELERLRQRMNRVWESYEDGGMPKDKMMARVSELQQRETELRQRLDAMDPASAQEAVELRDFIDTARELLSKKTHVSEYGVFVVADGFGLDVTDVVEGGEPRNLPLVAEAIKTRDRDMNLVNLDYRRGDLLTQLLARKRRLLERFQVRVVVLPERVEIHGFVPTQVLDRPQAIRGTILSRGAMDFPSLPPTQYEAMLRNTNTARARLSQVSPSGP